MNIKNMQDAAEDAAVLMRSLAHETRLMILCQLTESEKSVGALAELLGLKQANVSQQLALLRKDGLVKTRRDAQTVYYRLEGDTARRVIEVLYDLYCAPTQDKGSRR